ncbi:MAG: TRAP transporter substrate-binding protein DctP [Gammaproteobacteria bacterium]
MMTMRRASIITLLVAALILRAPLYADEIGSEKAAAEEVRLSVVSSWNGRQNFTADFLKYVAAVNEAGKGIVQLEFLGGPSVIPQRQLLYALRRGVIDIAFGGATYYLGIIPEGDAIFGSTITPWIARYSGALDALQPYWEKRANARLIGWMQSGVGANIYLRDKPAIGQDGLPDLSGLKIRTSPSNREILTALGARAIQIPVKEIYTSLQRGTVDGLAFTTIGLPDLGIEEFIHYRIDPEFLQLAMVMQINLDTWNSLSPRAQEIIERQAIFYEELSRQTLQQTRQTEHEQLKQQGLVSIKLEGEAAKKYRDLAREIVWQRLSNRAPESAHRLRPLFFWPEASP